MSSTRDKRSIDSIDDLYREAIKSPESENRRLEDALSEEFLGGDVFSADASAEGSYGQLIMHSLASHDPGWHGKEVAIAADKMRVMVKVRGGKPITSYQLHHGLEQLGVSYGIDWQALAKVEECSKAGVHGEVLVASGTPAQARRSVIFQEVERGIDVDGSIFWLADGVKLDGAGLSAMFSAETVNGVEKTAMIVKAVAAGTVLARIFQNPSAQPGTNVMGEIIDPADDLLPERGDNVRHDEQAGTYVAALYGYLLLEGNTMSVLPPIWVAPDHLSAYYVNCTQIGAPCYPSVNDLFRTLLKLNIREDAIRRGIIDKLFERLTRGQLLTARTVKIAEAIAPKAGRSASYAFFVDMGNKAETIQSDGTMDLCERNAVVAIKAGTLIAEKITATQGIPGADLFGGAIGAADGMDQVVAFDDLVRSEELAGTIRYYAQKDGNLRFAQNRLTICDLYTVAGDVDGGTGNLDRQEDLLINGSVMSGFTVRSQGNISIAGSVYNGDKVLAGGDVTIGEGIIGSETRVVALGHLQAVFVQDAEVIVKGDALVKSYLYKAVLRANGTITVVNSEEHGHKSGRIIGGLTCASRGILVSRVGHPGQTGAVLAILPDPEFSGQLKRLEDEGRNCREGIARISRTLPFQNFDAAVIKKTLAQMPVEQRDSVIKLLTTFNSLIKRQQNIEALRKEVNMKMQSDLRNGTIQIIQEIRQGSEIQFGDKKLVIAADQAGTTFTLQGGEIV
jgi:hypothetical protein